MGEYIIRGGNVLSGEIRVSGAKNAVLPIICGACLMRDAVIYNCPRLSDVAVSMDILRELGAKCSLVGNVLVVSGGMGGCSVSKELCEKMRSSVTFLGALLGRCGRGEIYCPGGCSLGKRPIDLHLSAFEKMGIEVRCEEDRIICKGKPVGADITLSYPSVGATENIMLAAVCAKGSTVIRNCAREPEIAALGEFLRRGGAKISGEGTSIIKIEGVKELGSCEYTVPGDRIEAGTYLCAAALTGGELYVKGSEGCNLKPVIEILRGGGCVIKDCRHCIYIDAPKRLKAVRRIVTAPYPGFPTDMQSQLCAVMAKAEGECIVEERVFEARNKHIKELVKMGADIKCGGESYFIIKGTDKLTGCPVCARELRGGAALAIAALGAEGESVIENAGYIDRGYEGFADKISQVGGEIMRR